MHVFNVIFQMKILISRKKGKTPMRNRNPVRFCYMSICVRTYCLVRFCYRYYIEKSYASLFLLFVLTFCTLRFTTIDMFDNTKNILTHFSPWFIVYTYTNANFHLLFTLQYDENVQNPTKIYESCSNKSTFFLHIFYESIHFFIYTL